jgi:hypothetical protein
MKSFTIPRIFAPNEDLDREVVVHHIDTSITNPGGRYFGAMIIRAGASDGASGTEYERANLSRTTKPVIGLQKPLLKNCERHHKVLPYARGNIPPLLRSIEWKLVYLQQTGSCCVIRPTHLRGIGSGGECDDDRGVHATGVHREGSDLM